MGKILCYDSFDRVLNYFYQWDINQTIKIKGISPETVTEIHFCAHGDDMAMLVNPSLTDDYITVGIPNILLQQHSPIFIYLYQASEDSGKTIHLIQVPVKARPKPSNYVYTETEVLNYVTLDERVSALERLGGYGDKSVVWTINGKSGDVILTPEDIGALPKNAAVVNALSNLDIENLINSVV